MIDAIRIADERVGEAAEVDQAVPVGIVAGEAGDFETEHDPDMSERNFCRKPRETAPLNDAGAGHAEVLVDDDDLLRRPAECACPGGQRILTLRRFAIVLDLGGRGLSNIHKGSAA